MGGTKIDYGAKARKTKEIRKAQDNLANSSNTQEHIEAPQAAPQRPVSSDNIYTELVGIRISEKQKKYLKQVALDNNTTVSNLIRDLIDSYSKS